MYRAHRCPRPTWAGLEITAVEKIRRSIFIFFQNIVASSVPFRQAHTQQQPHRVKKIPKQIHLRITPRASFLGHALPAGRQVLRLSGCAAGLVLGDAGFEVLEAAPGFYFAPIRPGDQRCLCDSHGAPVHTSCKALGYAPYGALLITARYDGTAVQTSHGSAGGRRKKPQGTQRGAYRFITRRALSGKRQSNRRPAKFRVKNQAGKRRRAIGLMDPSFSL